MPPRNQISATAGIPKSVPEPFSTRRARSTGSVVTQCQSDLELLRPRSSIRLRTWAAIATSLARASSLWKRSPSPMTCFQRANWPSTSAL